MTQLDFKQIYIDVPEDQKRMLIDFRVNHPYTQLTVNGKTMRYISCGDGERRLLLLHGGFLKPDMWFYSILKLENRFRILAPDLSETYDQETVRSTLLAILMKEGFDKITIAGISGGAGMAQYILQYYPQRVENVVFSHTGAIQRDKTKRYRRLLTVMRIMPLAILKTIARQRQKYYPAHSQWKKFARAYLKERGQSIKKENFIQFFDQGIKTTEKFEFDRAVVDAFDGKILILATQDDETAMNDLPIMQARYPQAHTYIFEEGGHHTFLLFPEVYTAVLEEFLDESVG